MHPQLVDPEDSNITTAINSTNQTDQFTENVKEVKQIVTWSQGIHALVQTNDKELFNFDLEVMPILEVLADKTIEQSVIEMREQSEIANIDEFKRKIKELRKSRQEQINDLEDKEKFM